MIADWKDYRCLPKRNQQIMVYYARKSRMLNIFSITLMGFSLAGYMLTPIINTWNSDVPWNTTTRSLPIRGFFPFSFKESPVFEILYTMQSIVGFFACTMIVSIDCFLCTVMLHACGQFDILAATLERYDSSTRHDYTKDMRSRTCACLSCFVKRHVHILKYMDIVQRSFSDFHLIQLLTYCFNLVLCGHQLITYFQDHNFYDFITFIIYVLTITCIIFIYCYLSECVMEKSKNIGTIAYNLEWCRFPRDSNLAIIIARSRIPCKITAGKFVTMSFSYFTTIIISIISYISVLAAFK
nr:PREDICTED: odorant receptor 22c-like [Linepithema humile]